MRRVARRLRLATRDRVARELERLLASDDGRRILHEVTRGAYEACVTAGFAIDPDDFFGARHEFVAG